MNPLVSIIIPTYNRAHLICETLDSILEQTYTNWECIVVDDGSTDNTAKVLAHYIEKDNRFQYYQRPKEKIKGPNSCRNYGFEMSKGAYINWFDSDDVYLKEALETFVSNINEDVDVVICKLVKIDSSTNEVIGYNRIFSENLLAKYYTGFLSFYTCGPLWRKTFLEKQIELFDENIRFLDDWDFNLRMLYENPKINFLDKILIKYKIDSNSLSHQIYKLRTTEIHSEIYAREKQLRLIKENHLIGYLFCLNFTRERYKIVLRDCLMGKGNHQDKKKLLFYILRKDFEMKNMKNLVKTILGYISFSVFNKGYEFFK